MTARARGLPRSRLKNPRRCGPCAIPPIIWKARGRPNSSRRFALNEGARNAGCASASAAPCAKGKKHTSVVATVTPEASGVPHAMVGTACCVRHPRWPVLSTPPLCGLTDSSIALCTRSDGVVLPLGAKPMRRDDTPWAVRVTAWSSTGRDETARPLARRAPDHPARVRTPHAATASRPAYRDDRETPLMTGRDG